MTTEPSRQEHETIARAERFRMLMMLNDPEASQYVKDVLPTVNALLSDYLHRLPAKLVYSADTKEWLANSSRFLCTDSMGDFGPHSAELPVMALTQENLRMLDKGREYLIPFLVETGP